MAAYNRRSFLDVLGAFSATTLLSAFTRPAWSRDLDKALLRAENRPSHELAGDEDFWHFVQQSFTESPELINLNNGGVSPEARADNIRKFENLGTRPFFIEQAIGKAIEFYDMIGPARKEQRLFYLKNYWMTAVRDIPKVKLYTSLKPGFGCAIGVIGVEGKTPGDLDNYLFNEHKIHVTNVNWEGVHGVRITPNVYTTTKNLDRLIAAIGEYAKA